LRLWPPESKGRWPSRPPRLQARSASRIAGIQAGDAGGRSTRSGKSAAPLKNCPRSHRTIAAAVEEQGAGDNRKFPANVPAGRAQGTPGRSSSHITDCAGVAASETGSALVAGFLSPRQQLLSGGTANRPQGWKSASFLNTVRGRLTNNETGPKRGPAFRSRAMSLRSLYPRKASDLGQFISCQGRRSRPSRFVAARSRLMPARKIDRTLSSLTADEINANWKLRERLSLSSDKRLDFSRALVRYRESPTATISLN